MAIDPKTVTAPKEFWKLKEVIHTDHEEGWSVAEGWWDEELVLAVRWDGYDPEQPLGFPVAFGQFPMWFILPSQLMQVVKEEIARRRADLVRPHVGDTTLDAGYQAMAADTEREAEAQEWCNALAGDVADETR